MAGALLSRGILVTTFFRSISDASMKKTSVANISRAPCSTCAKQLEFYAYRFFENLSTQHYTRQYSLDILYIFTYYAHFPRLTFPINAQKSAV